jgi:DNA-binding response OmpR family regulator
MDGGVFRFGHVAYDAARRRLAIAGRPVELDRPSAAILMLLMREAGEDVDKDRLLEAGWPGRVVHENSLAKAIGRLREALGEDAAALETVHGFGYRLATDVAPPAPMAPQTAIALRTRRRSAFFLSIAAPLTLGALWLAAHSGATASLDAPPLIKGEPADSIGRVLWVDDHPQNNTAERTYLERRHVAVYEVTTTEEALELLSMYEYRAVISDMNRNGKPLDGLTLVKEMRRRKDATPFILYTVVPSAAQRRLLGEAGGQAAAAKPAELYAAVLPLVAKQRANRRS